MFFSCSYKSTPVIKVLCLYNQLDKPDANELPFDEIAVQPFEPIHDPTILGLKKDPDIREKKRRMKAT